MIAYVIPLLAGLIDLPYGILVKFLSPIYGLRIPARADTPQRRRRGLVVVLGGIEGPSLFNGQMVRGLLASRFRGAVRRVDWNAGPPFICSVVNLMSRRHHERQARRVADAIVAYRREHPAAPVSLVAQSGGCWIAVRAAEMLPATMRISTIVLHAAAISPRCDVSTAAARCDGGIVSIEACGDYVMLGAGTLLFGTSNRRWSASVGLVGFDAVAPGVRSLRWSPHWLKYGHLGNHTSSAAFRVMRDVVAPLLRPFSNHHASDQLSRSHTA